MINIYYGSMFLKGNDPRYPKFIINGRNCKFTIISMNNTRVIEKEGKFAKDKTSERKDTILPEEATHFGDAVDKRFWTKYRNDPLQSRRLNVCEPEDIIYIIRFLGCERMLAAS